MKNRLFTSESVGKGHPDKICDQISDAILDACIQSDPNSKVAIEVMASNHLILIGGELNTKAYVDVVKISWKILKDLGYKGDEFTIISNINKQSDEINKAVAKDNLCAGDQGMVFGYATNEIQKFKKDDTSYMPLAITLAHELVRKAEEIRKIKKYDFIKSDMKSQVTINYSNDKDVYIDTVLMSIQHSSKVSLEELKEVAIKEIIDEVLNKFNLKDNRTKIMVNAGGTFIVGGPIGDTGLTGRKIIVDTYGGYARHGGGAFSGKDYSKVDRSGAYFARYLAKNIVASGLCDSIEIQLSFAFGMPKIISYDYWVENLKINQNKFDEFLNKLINEYDVQKIVDDLKLKEQKYQHTATYGHFGREDYEFSWEKLDLVNKIKEMIR